MWNLPSKNLLKKIPKLYETDEQPVAEKLIYLHFFIFDCDWFISEYDGDDLFYGYAILNGDHINAEWGYIAYSELKDININHIEVDSEQNWQVKKVVEISKIKIS